MKIFDRYLLKILTRFLWLISLAFLILFDFFDFLNQLSQVGEGTYRLKTALWYVILTSGSKLAPLLPVLGLLAVLLAQGQLVDRNESLALEAAGYSRARQGLILLWGLFFWTGLFWIAEESVLKKLEVHAWQTRAKALSSQRFTLYGEGFWTKSGNTFLKVKRIFDDGLIEGVEIFEFQNNSLRTYLYAPLGKAQKGGWLLWNVKERKIYPQRVEEKNHPKFLFKAPFPAKEVQGLALPVEFLDLKTLWHYWKTLKEGGQNVYRYSLMIWEKILTPPLTLAMGILALSFTTSPLKRKKPVLTRLIAGLFGGLFFYLLREALAHAGRVYGLPVPLVTSTPLILVLLISFWRFKKGSL